MRRTSIVLAALTLGAPLASTGAQDIIVRDIGGAEITYANTHTAKIRRGMTSRVTLIKDFIDWTLGQQSASGATIANVSTGHTSNGTGFIAMDVTVSATKATGSTVTLSIGVGQEKFNFTVVNRGLVTSITGAPQPSTIQAGTPWVATVQGTDLGVPVADILCHNVTVGTRTSSSVQFTLTRQSNCSGTSFGLSLDPSAADDPPNYRFAGGSLAVLNGNYLTGSITCTSDPNLGVTNVTAPANGGVIVFSTGTPSPASVQIRWDSLTGGSRPAPNNEWVVTRGTKTKAGNFMFINSLVIKGLSTTMTFAIPDTHSVSVRPKNCGQTAPSTTVTFSTRY